MEAYQDYLMLFNTLKMCYLSFRLTNQGIPENFQDTVIHILKYLSKSGVKFS